jgi:hypothetical protein
MRRKKMAWRRQLKYRGNGVMAKISMYQYLKKNNGINISISGNGGKMKISGETAAMAAASMAKISKWQWRQ